MIRAAAAGLHWLAYKFTTALLRVVLTPFLQVVICGRERVGIGGGCILASNHISHFDPPCISCYVRRKIDWMAISDLFKNRFLANWLWCADTFPVERNRPDRTAIRTALQRLAQGRMVGIFPEGGIRDGVASIIGGASMKPGMGMLAQMSGAPVLPCVILGSDLLYSKRAWRSWRSTTVYIKFGELLRCEGEGKSARADLDQRLAKELSRLCNELVNQFKLPDSYLPKRASERFHA